MKSLSSYQLARDLELNQKSAWYMQTRIRAEMVTKQGCSLQGIIEADETYIGGKPRKSNNRKLVKPSKRGRGTDKTAVVGAVERGGEVKAEVAHDLSGKGILKFIRDTVQPDGSVLINRPRGRSHKRHQGVLCAPETGLVRLPPPLSEAIHSPKRTLRVYVAEACWRYNHRKDANAFGSFIRGCFA